MNFKKLLLVTSTFSVLSACVDDGINGTNGAPGSDGLNSLINQIELAAGDSNCFNGGVQIDSGLDDNANGLLESAEIDATQFVCSPALPTSITNLNSSKTSFSIDQAIADLGTASFSLAGNNGTTVDLNVGFGSGAYHYSNDPANVFYTITDRGPNIKCKDSGDVFAIPDFCLQNNVAVSGKIFPIVDYAPSIYQWQLVENTIGERKVEVIAKIALKDSNGNLITGLSNPLTFSDGTSNTELAFDALGNELSLDPAGLDPEAMVKLADGSFWIGEEYGPSLVHVSATGEVLQRIVPTGVESQLANAGYPVNGGLPAIYQYRKLNRGIESIAVSPDETTLYFIMQSPLNNPDYKNSRHVRLMAYSLVDGELGSAIGEYVYVIDPAESFSQGDTGDVGKKQKDVKVSEMFAMGSDDLVILERISKTTKLYRVNLSSAENILGSDLSAMGIVANENNQLATLEDIYNLQSANASPVAKALVFNSLTDIESLPKKVEGLALLDDQHLLMINDNDFGIAGDATEINVVNLGERLSSNAGRITEKPTLALVGRYQASTQGEGAAEIVQFHEASGKLFAINGDVGNRIEVASLSALPTTPMANPLTDFNLTATTYDLPSNVTVDGNIVNISDINSIAIVGDQLAVAVANVNSITEDGVILHYTLANDGSFDVMAYTAIRVGVLPDNVAISPDGTKIVVANEGEAGDDPLLDAKGSIAIIDVVNSVPNTSATLLGFEDYLDIDEEGININPDSIDFSYAAEPEYVAVSANSEKAFVTLQEVNAVAIVNLTTKTIETVKSLGVKDHSKDRNALDASDKDDKVNIASYDNLVGLYQPDTIVSYQVNGKTYVLTANEGDAGDGFQDVDERVEDLSLDTNAFPNATELQTDDALGRLKVVPYLGKNAMGDYEKLYAFGGRSFSIWDESAELVFDSGNDFEKITAGLYGVDFNNDEDENDPDTRSDAKGPEPEALAVGKVGERIYAFIGMERMGGIAMYDVTNPYGVQFITYTNNRDFSDINNGDLAPEGMKFVSAEASPTGRALLLVGNEISGTVAVYQVKN